MSDELAKATLPPVTDKQINEIRAKLRNGLDVEAICMQLGIANIEAVTSILKDQKKVNWNEKSNVEILQEHKTILQQMIETAQYEYFADPTDRHAYAVTTLIQTSQAIIGDLESRRDPTKMSSEILSKVIQPLLRALIKSLTIESGKARASVALVIPPEKMSMLTYAINDMLKGFGATSTTEYRVAAQTLGELLGVKTEDVKSSQTVIEVMPNEPNS